MLLHTLFIAEIISVSSRKYNSTKRVCIYIRSVRVCVCVQKMKSKHFSYLNPLIPLPEELWLLVSIESSRNILCLQFMCVCVCIPVFHTHIPVFHKMRVYCANCTVPLIFHLLISWRLFYSIILRSTSFWLTALCHSITWIYLGPFFKLLDSFFSTINYELL